MNDAQRKAMFAKLKKGDAVTAFGNRGFVIKKIGNTFALVRLNDHKGHNGHDQVAGIKDIMAHPSGTKMRVGVDNESSYSKSYLYKHNQRPDSQYTKDRSNYRR